ncbi:MAG TPA: alpha/beta hydrolase [Mycobacteriales bacterium]|nr:alpha/beta hydrolase [Mycobacteriales bacterium]
MEYVDYDGHRIAYRVSGRGAALVVLNLYRRQPDLMQARLLSHHFRVFQIWPLGFGYSDRVPGYSGELLVDQVLAVLARYGVRRFVVWGYSAGSAMGLCVARATDRTAGLVCGGFAPLPLRPATLRQLDRRLRPDHPNRSLWWWFDRFDWAAEMAAMECPRLCYWGGEDNQMAVRLRDLRNQIPFQEVDFIELPGLDHGRCNTPEALRDAVVPAVADWLARRLGPTW